MKKGFVIGLLAVFCGVFFVGCKENEFSYIKTRDGQSVFLDGKNGKVIYVNSSNRVIDFVDLNLSAREITTIRRNKEANDALQRMREWDKRTISGTNYSLELSTRFYDDRLLYILEMSPFDNNASGLANTITVHLLDEAGFVLEVLRPQVWSRIVNSEGKATAMSSRGGIPITLDNYMEISNWSPTWRN